LKLLTPQKLANLNPLIRLLDKKYLLVLLWVRQSDPVSIKFGYRLFVGNEFPDQHAGTADFYLLKI
jgi:hypothetical protein